MNRPLAIGAAVALAYYLWAAKAKASPATPPPQPPPPQPPPPTTPEPVTPPPPPPPPPPKPGERGDDPLPTPTQGKFYRVKDGDSLSRIAATAGLGGTSWRKIRDAAENAWLPQMYADGRFFAGTGERALPLYKWFDAPGYKTANHWASSSSRVFPSIFIPRA